MGTTRCYDAMACILRYPGGNNATRDGTLGTGVFILFLRWERKFVLITSYFFFFFFPPAREVLGLGNTMGAGSTSSGRC